MKKLILRMFLLISLIFGIPSVSSAAAEKPIGKTAAVCGKEADFCDPIDLTRVVESVNKKDEPVIESPETGLTTEEINLIALIVMAEAEEESEIGKRLVIDTILNRVDSGYFPDSVYEVVYQPNQFSSVWNGRIQRCYVSDDIRQLVIDESINRLNENCVFFTAGGYGRYGKPMFQVGNHYFSSYE